MFQLFDFLRLISVHSCQYFYFLSVLDEKFGEISLPSPYYGKFLVLVFDISSGFYLDFLNFLSKFRFQLVYPRSQACWLLCTGLKKDLLNAQNGHLTKFTITDVDWFIFKSPFFIPFTFLISSFGTGTSTESTAGPTKVSTNYRSCRLTGNQIILLIKV